MILCRHLHVKGCSSAHFANCGQARPSLLQPADARTGGGVTKAETHLENARQLCRSTEPPLYGHSAFVPRGRDIGIGRANMAWQDLFGVTQSFLRNRKQEGSALLFGMNARFEDHIGRVVLRALGGEIRVKLQGRRP